MKSPPQGLPRPGDVLAGRFRVERVLGVGGMGSVFAAEDLRFARRVAIKLMLPDLMEIPEFAARFAREAQAASSLSSEHAARVYEIGRLPDGSPYMVLELLQGRDLDRVLRTRGPLPIAEAVQYILETCHAIGEAHGLGIVHRDLKPSNLYLAEREGAPPVVKVLDFGISKSTPLDAGSSAGRPGEPAGLTATESTLGSPHYMSPEQLRSAKRVDRRTDVWSLGIILHKLLSGHLAFESESVGAHLAAIVADPPTPLRQHRADAPEGLEVAILRCLQKDLALRFQNVGQLAVALAPFAAPSARPLIEAVVAIVGREAALAPLSPLAGTPSQEDARQPAPATVRMPQLASAPTPEPATVAGWTPVQRPSGSPQTGGSSVPGWTPALPASPPAGSRRALWAAAVVGVAMGTGILGLVVAISGPSGKVAPAASAAAAASSAPAPSTLVAASIAPAASSAAPAGPREVRVKIEVEPADATLELDGKPIRENPFRLAQGEGSHKLVIRAPGYAPETREVTTREDTALAVVLHRADAGGPMPGRRIKGPVETSL
jgi:serine/threonine-protein kinase